MKKMTSIIIITLCLSVLLSTTSFATVSSNEQKLFSKKVEAFVSAIDLSKEINDAQNNFIDKNISKEVLDNISVHSLNDAVTVNYTVKKLGTISKENGTQSNIYSLTATTKTTYNEEAHQWCTAWISMQWIDNLGLSNQIVSVAGGWSNPPLPIISSRYVKYGIADGVGGWEASLTSEKYPSNNDWYYSAPSNFTGAILRAYSVVEFSGYGSSGSLFCEVQPTIWD